MRDYWFCHDVDRSRKSEAGCIVAWEFKPWRLMSKTPDEPHEGEPTWQKYFIFVLRPVDNDPTWTASTGDLHLRGPDYHLDVLRDHYGLCVHCNELLPCRSIQAERKTADEVERMARYEISGICPACGEPVTHRQQSETFPNVVVPLGPPVTFHAGRRKCRYSMEKYRETCGQPESQLRIDGGLT